MRTKMVRSAVLAAVLAGTAAVWAVSTGSASADTAPKAVVLTEAERRPFAIPGMESMIVDGVHKHLLISVPDDGTVVVLDYDGKKVGTLAAGAGVRKLVLSPDSSKLYAAVENSQEIVEFDTARLAETARYPLAFPPEALAFAGGRLWFSYQDYGYNGNFASLDLTDGSVEAHDAPGIVSDPLIAGTGNLLAVSAGPGITRGSVFLFDVSGGEERQLARQDYYDDQLTENRELQFSADAQQLVIGANGGLRFMAVADLAPLAVVTDYRYQGLDVATGGGMLVSERPDAELAELNLYPAGSTTAARSWDVPLTGAMYAPSISDVAWEPGGGHAFVVTTEFLGPQSLWVLTSPALSSTAITLSAPATATRAATLTVSGTITGSLPAGTSLTVTRKDLESTTALPAIKTDASGKFSFTDKPPAGGAVSYTIAYAGDSTHKATSATASVAVSRVTPALTLNGNGSVNAYGATYSLTAHLGTTYKNRTVEIWADPWGTETNRLLKKATVDSKGNVTTSFRLTRNTAVTAVFTGDSQYAPLTVKSNLYTRPSISTTVSGHYKVSGGYYYFHKTTNPRFTTTMTAYPKRQEKVLLESYTGGTWKAWKSAMVTLDSAGKAVYTLTGTHSTGIKYRMRAAYISGTSGDNVNYTTYGPYQYFTFAK